MSRAPTAFPASPAAAVAWGFWRRHRWGLVAVAGFPLALVLLRLTGLEGGEPVAGDSLRFALTATVPASAAFFYLVSVFTYGLSGDLAARASIFPRRMFAMPASTTALVAWPMVFGTGAVLMLWFTTRSLAVWPASFGAPWFWPGLLAAASLAWIQALTWMPYGLPGIRIVVTVLSLTMNDVIVFTALTFHASDSVMVAILAPQLPLAFLVARFGVERARRGVVPDWSGAFAGYGRLIGATAPPHPTRFRSPRHAQAWLEWRQHGRSLPTWVAIVVPCELALMFIERGTSPITFAAVVAALLTPPFVASFVAAGVRRSGVGARDTHGLTPFLATRPMTDPSLVAAKLTMAIRSTLSAWLVVLVLVPSALLWSGSWPAVLDHAHHGITFFGATRHTVLLLVVLLGLIATTWKQLVQALYIGLTGREWLVKASVFLTIVFFAALAIFLGWVGDHRGAQAALWGALPWILAGFAVAKVSLALPIAVRLYDAALLTDRTLIIGAALWCGAVLALYAVMSWFVSSPFVPHHVLLFIAILAVPLVRLSAAPLMLAWNRHR